MDSIKTRSSILGENEQCTDTPFLRQWQNRKSMFERIDRSKGDGILFVCPAKYGPITLSLFSEAHVAMGVGVLGLDEPGLAAVPLPPSLRAGGNRGWKANLVLVELTSSKKQQRN
jgi:hypothetical protein